MDKCILRDVYGTRHTPYLRIGMRHTVVQIMVIGTPSGAFQPIVKDITDSRESPKSGLY